MAFTFQDRLNPKLWDHGDRLRPIVRLKLFQAALAFYQFLAVDRLFVEDIILTGSNAAFNYTSLSDIDVHLIVDYAKIVCPNMAENMFLTKIALWRRMYAVTIFSSPVELYVEDSAHPVQAKGVFSLLHDEWVRKPSRTRPEPDDSAVASKVATLQVEIEGLLVGDPNRKQIDKMIGQLRAMRQSGLMSGGEFSVENIAFKVLRDSGLIEKLYDQRTQSVDRSLSLSASTSKLGL